MKPLQTIMNAFKKSAKVKQSALTLVIEVDGDRVPVVIIDSVVAEFGDGSGVKVDPGTYTVVNLVDNKTYELVVAEEGAVESLTVIEEAPAAEEVVQSKVQKAGKVDLSSFRRTVETKQTVASVFHIVNEAGSTIEVVVVNGMVIVEGTEQVLPEGVYMTTEGSELVVNADGMLVETRIPEVAPAQVTQAKAAVKTQLPTYVAQAKTAAKTPREQFYARLTYLKNNPDYATQLRKYLNPSAKPLN